MSDTPVPQAPLPQVLSDLVAYVGGAGAVWDGETFEFESDKFLTVAWVLDGGARLHVAYDIGPIDVPDDEFVDWLEETQETFPALLELFEDYDTSELHLYATFERPVRDHSWADDWMPDHVVRLRGALQDKGRVAIPAERQVLFGDPVVVEPASGWLLMGDAPSLMSAEQSEDQRFISTFGSYVYEWTGPKAAAVGDFLMFYFTAPDKAVRYVARAASDSYFSSDIEVNADRPVAAHQWWVKTTELLEVEPVPFSTVREAFSGHLVLKGRSGRYAPPSVVEALAPSFRAVDPSRQADVDAVVHVPVGLADLPKPDSTTWKQWVDIAAGALPQEKHVSDHLVKPLMRMLLLPSSRFSWEAEYRVARGSADFVVLEAKHPRCVIEVKLAAITPKDLQQLQRYTEGLGCRGALMDARRILLVEDGAVLPFRTFDRRRMTWDDALVVGAHLQGEQLPV